MYVIETGPKNIYNWAKGYCQRCDKSFLLRMRDRDISPICLYCGSSGNVIYQVQLFVKDINQESDEIYRLLLYTQKEKGKEFFNNETPRNLYRNNGLCAKLKDINNLIRKYGVYIDCIIEIGRAHV